MPASLRSICICIFSICFLPAAHAQTDTANVIIGNVSCHGINDGSIFYRLTGGPGPLRYNWSNGVAGYATGSCTYSVTLNNPGSPLLQYQVRVDVNLASGMNADYSDIVFMDSLGTLFPFWLTDFPTASAATFWVRVPFIPTGISVFYLSYCGNASISQSNPLSTFEFFDNFDSGSISAWTGSCYNVDVSGESCASSVSATQFFSPGYSMNLTGASSCFVPSYNGVGSRVSRTVPIINDSLVIDFENKVEVTLYGFCSGGTSTTNQIFADSNYLGNGQSVWQGGSCATNQSNWGTNTSQSFEVTTGSTTIALQTYGGDCDNSQGWYDNVRIRKYRANPPLVALDTTPQLSMANLSAGTYALTLVDVSGDTVTRDIIITGSQALLLNMDSLSNPCAGVNTGAAWVSIGNGTAPYTVSWSNNQSTDTITGLAPGVYTVTVSDVNSCSASSSVHVDSSVSTQAIITSNKSQMCSGDSAQICLTGSYTNYLWNNGETTACIFARLAGNYYVAVTDSFHCTINSNHLAINILPVPAVSISVNGDTLTAYNGESYLWYRNDVLIPNANSNVYIVQQSGGYTLEVIDSNGCRAVSTEVTITKTGTEHLIEDGYLKVYPNPLEAKIWNLECKRNQIGSKVEIFDNTGRLFYNSEITQEKSEIPINAESGIYVMRISSKEIAITLKLIKL